MERSQATLLSNLPYGHSCSPTIQALQLCVYFIILPFFMCCLFLYVSFFVLFSVCFCVCEWMCVCCVVFVRVYHAPICTDVHPYTPRRTPPFVRTYAYIRLDVRPNRTVHAYRYAYVQYVQMYRHARLHIAMHVYARVMHMHPCALVHVHAWVHYAIKVPTPVTDQPESTSTSTSRV